MRRRIRREQANAAAAPSTGRGPGTESVGRGWGAAGAGPLGRKGRSPVLWLLNRCGEPAPMVLLIPPAPGPVKLPPRKLSPGAGLPGGLAIGGPELGLEAMPNRAGPAAAL